MGGGNVVEAGFWREGMISIFANMLILFQDLLGGVREIFSEGGVMGWKIKRKELPMEGERGEVGGWKGVWGGGEVGRA